MTSQENKDFGDSFPDAPPQPRMTRKLPVALLLMIAGLAGLIILLALSY